MTKLNQKVGAVVTAGVMFLSMASSVFAQTTLEISGNGDSSSNGVALTQTTTTNVVQSNSADIHNDVNANANSGENDASRNTGGSTSIDTGNAKTNVTVANTANSNAANVACCNANSDTNVLISKNGVDTTNTVALGQKSTVGLYQDNNANIKNDVDAKANTGKNDAKSNTGGDVTVNTGDATTMVGILNTANANVATVGGNGQTGTGLVDLTIIGNGDRSDNAIALTLAHSTTVKQDNSARIDNDVDANANTGKNNANRNTGGDVLIDTGNAKTNVGIDNTVNFNFANVDCGCLLDVTGKVAKNGVDSTNKLVAALGSDLGVFQDNCGTQAPTLLETLSVIHREGCKLNNDVNAKAGTGENDNKSNTGSPLSGDPAVWTGNAESNTDLSTTGNANAYGADNNVEWPTFDFNFNGASLSWLFAGLLH